MAYAAVVSLRQSMRDLLSVSELINFSDTTLILDQFSGLDSFLRTMRSLPSNKIVDAAAASERRVRDAAQQLQLLIDSHISDQLDIITDHDHDAKISRLFTLLLSEQLPILQEEIHSFPQQQQQQQQRYDCSSSSSDYTYTSVAKQQQQQKQNPLLGFDEQMKTLKEWILSSTSNFDSRTLVGMTGIGKTSLAKHIYNDPDVIDAFETRVFLHIGPRYTQFHEIVMLLLNHLGVVLPPDNTHLHTDPFYMKHQFSNAVSGKKCLFVLDDVWTDDGSLLQLHYNYGPSDSSRNRFIITSQIQSSSDTYYFGNEIILPLLNEDDGWKLLRQTAFTSEDKCDPEHEKFGKKIATNCQGLPAAIIQVGENLRGKSIQEWETLSENEDPLVITRDDDTPLSKALYFSYMMLPQNLRIFFLYMGVFPKGYGISRSMLIRLCVSEGFVDPEWDDYDIEAAAGKHLDRLICRSVVLVEKKASADIQKTKNCRLHFTFRSLCVNEAKSEKFFHVLKKYTDCIPDNMRSQQRLCIHNNVVVAFREVYEWMESVPNAQSILCFGPKQQYPIALPLSFRLLKVLDALAIRFYEFPLQILALLHLRYLAITCDRELPNSISRLWNLQVLIFGRHHNIKLSDGPAYLPMDIWNMHELKQLYCMGLDLPAPPPDDPDLVLKSLLTLSGVSVHSCTVEVLSRIPMLRRVAVQIESAHDSMETFSFFRQFTSLYKDFESFKCVVVNPNLRPQLDRCVPNFPVNITKISLSGCGFPWEKIEVISTLRYLVVLKLRWHAFCGPVWKVSKGQFVDLEFLLLEDLDIEQLACDDFVFSRVDRVIIRHCYKLGRIGDRFRVSRLMEVDDCSLSFMEEMREWRSIRGAVAKVRSSSTDL